MSYGGTRREYPLAVTDDGTTGDRGYLWCSEGKLTKVIDLQGKTTGEKVCLMLGELTKLLAEVRAQRARR
jgi:hypothetical protein